MEQGRELDPRLGGLVRSRYMRDGRAEDESLGRSQARANQWVAESLGWYFSESPASALESLARRAELSLAVDYTWIHG